MNEDYLWDRSGEPDPEILRLEGMLGQLRLRETGQSFVSTKPPITEAGRRWTWTGAAVVRLAPSVPFAVQRIRTAGPVTAWQLSVAGQKASAIRVWSDY